MPHPIHDYLQAYGQHLTGETGPPSLKRKRRPTIPQPAGPAKGSGPSLQSGDVAAAPFVPPPDPLYDQQLATLTKTSGDSLAALQNQRNAGLANYGYNVTTDSSGNPVAVNFDPNNPYSQAALLRTRTAQQKTGNTNRYAAAGQLYAGSYQNAQDETQTQFNRSDDALSKAALAFVMNNADQMNQVRNDEQLGQGQASADRLGRLPTNPLYDPSTAVKPGAVRAGGLAPDPTAQSYAVRARKVQRRRKH